MSEHELDHHRIHDAALQLAADHGWDGVALRDIARAAGVGLSALHAAYPGKQDIVRAHARRVDTRVLDELDPENLEEAARDRLFDVLMHRFDILQQNRAGVAAIVRSYRRDPGLALGGVMQVRESMAAMLEAADISSSGCAGRIRRDGLVGVYLATLRVWLADDSTDMSSTMAALDRYLRRVEQPATMLENLRTRDLGAMAA